MKVIDLTPRVGDLAFVWWNTGRKAPEWAGPYYVARVHHVTPNTGTYRDIGWFLDVDPAITERSGRRMLLSMEIDNPRLLWRTHPSNPDPEALP